MQDRVISEIIEICEETSSETYKGAEHPSFAVLRTVCVKIEATVLPEIVYPEKKKKN